ncbi:unnamed protein product [Ambrosiozyma monospora]|uniref:Unnamed protein product n=1 Tax=Ambrosiozyma monospora TaxID=43982 RepID=A0ACB5U780_AMBMO|nr:unnamed protein product [Ambrosiozyma monospora]
MTSLSNSSTSSLHSPINSTHSSSGMQSKQPVNKSRKKSKGRVFQCTGYPNCNMTFTRSEHLARHIRKHTGERPFECEHCGKKFSRLDNLRQHKQTVHMYENFVLTYPGEKVNVRVKNNEERAREVDGTRHYIGAQPITPVMMNTPQQSQQQQQQTPQGQQIPQYAQYQPLSAQSQHHPQQQQQQPSPPNSTSAHTVIVQPQSALLPPPRRSLLNAMNSEFRPKGNKPRPILVSDTDIQNPVSHINYVSNVFSSKRIFFKPW